MEQEKSKTAREYFESQVYFHESAGEWVFHFSRNLKFQTFCGASKEAVWGAYKSFSENGAK